jgi:hypothetical protein
LDNERKECSWIEEEEVKVKVTARLYVSVSTLVILFYFRASSEKNFGGAARMLAVPYLA